MDELEIDGKKYFSSKRAAREHKYHIDYIGQLIRAGKVAGKKVGRSWYVEETSLRDYLLSEGGAPQKPATQPEQKVSPVVEAPAQTIEEKRFEPVVTPQHYPQPAPIQQPIVKPFEREERVVYFSAPVPEKKPNTLTYVEDDEPMLPALNGRVRANADFVAVPVRKIEEESKEMAPEESEQIEDDEPRITAYPRQKNKFFLALRMQVLAIIAIAVFAAAAIASSVIATSIQVDEQGVASVGYTLK